MGLKTFIKSLRRHWRGERPIVPVHRQRNDADQVYEKRMNDPCCLERYGYKVYSQNDEDGIIAEIFNRVGTTNQTFVEFGVHNGLECNSHFLLHKGWNGLWIDGGAKNCAEIRRLFSAPIAEGRLKVVNAFIDKDNINGLIAGVQQPGTQREERAIDLLSIDIDGNDYWVWEAITCVRPRVVVIEYNAKFPPDHVWTMKYAPNHIWKGDDKHGASLKSLELLGKKLGYQLVGTNLVGVNAFFVRQDIALNLFAQPATAENLYNPAGWSVGYVSGHPSREYIG